MTVNELPNIEKVVLYYRDLKKQSSMVARNDLQRRFRANVVAEMRQIVNTLVMLTNQSHEEVEYFLVNCTISTGDL